MTTAIGRSLQQRDLADIRTDLDAMRRALTDVALSGADLWTASWADLSAGLYDVGRTDQCLGRLVEGHADALRILDQAGTPTRPGIYGVWASRSAGTGLKAVQSADGWLLSGEVRFASGVDLIDRALVPGWVDDQHHLLFDLDVTDFETDRTGWTTAAMDASRTFSCACSDLPGGRQVGPSNFYLDRPGFAAGGIGPASVWAGGAQLLTDAVRVATTPFELSPHQRRRLGVMEHKSWLARAVLDQAVAAMTDSEPSTASAVVTQARTAVVEACEQVLDEVARIVGPAGLTQNALIARSHQDLGLYVRQHHLDATFERLGEPPVRTQAE